MGTARREAAPGPAAGHRAPPALPSRMELAERGRPAGPGPGTQPCRQRGPRRVPETRWPWAHRRRPVFVRGWGRSEIGRASCRERVWSGEGEGAEKEEGMERTGKVGENGE